ncbi:CLIP domain-containing serine protease 2-like [Ischnura elegans]|uniref:CLIP domain-containing serine protease 2-like n=1 Tax=Ischnura elegans TaxID=197161 RepID=UPI001ED88F61|nr:CLIP domain-containing serine protease 2-like [Ischnura elegans]
MMSLTRGPSWRSHLRLMDFLATILLLILRLQNGYALNPGDRCINPVEDEGTCIDLSDCEAILRTLKVKPIPQEAMDFLRRSRCGFRGFHPLVCCPSGNKTANVSALRPLVTHDVTHHPNLALLRTDICGPEYWNQVVGNVHLTELPWMALLEYSVKTGSPFRCGGAIISDRYVITAAHCVIGLPRNSSVISVRIGEYNLTSPIDCEDDYMGELKYCSPAPQDIAVEKVVVHPHFIGWPDSHNDIGLIRLSRPINFTDEAVRPICMPVGLAQQTEDLIGKNVEVSGWGSLWSKAPSAVLRKWNVPVVSHSRCAQQFEDVVPISEMSQICAGDAAGRATCSVDSGGPLKVHDLKARRNILHGILSYGPLDCDSEQKPGVYTRVGHFMKWILDNMEP